MAKKRIILVDDNPANLNACKKALKDLYDVYPAPSAEKMFEILNRVMPDLILLDVEMPGMHGYDAMRKLKAEETYKDIPVIFLSAMDDAQSEMEGLDLGAVDYIHKPFVSPLLIKRIQTHISIIEGKEELLSLNKSIESLLTEGVGRSHSELEEEALYDLFKESLFFARMGHQMRSPLTTVISRIESAIKSEDITQVRHFLGEADVESRLMLEMVDDIFDLGK